MKQEGTFVIRFVLLKEPAVISVIEIHKKRNCVSLLSAKKA